MLGQSVLWDEGEQVDLCLEVVDGVPPYIVEKDLPDGFGSNDDCAEESCVFILRTTVQMGRDSAQFEDSNTART